MRLLASPAWPVVLLLAAFLAASHPPGVQGQACASSARLLIDSTACQLSWGIARDPAGTFAVVACDTGGLYLYNATSGRSRVLLANGPQCNSPRDVDFDAAKTPSSWHVTGQVWCSA